MIVRTIHHFEDEPELVRFIPGSLLNHFWRRHPEWIVEEGRFQELEDGRLTTFDLEVRGTPCTVAYRIYPTIQAFESDFFRYAKVGDIALVDLMDAVQQPAGLHVYKRAVKILGEGAVYFLTAFPGQARRAGNKIQVLVKPVEVTELTRILADGLAIQ